MSAEDFKLVLSFHLALAKFCKEWGVFFLVFHLYFLKHLQKLLYPHMQPHSRWKSTRLERKIFLELHVTQCDKHRNLYRGWTCERGAIECGLPFNSAPGKEEQQSQPANQNKGESRSGISSLQAALDMAFPLQYGKAHVHPEARFLSLSKAANICACGLLNISLQIGIINAILK